MQRKHFGIIKSIAGTAFLGLGVFILYQNLSGAVTRLREALGSNGSAALGLPPAVIQAVSQVVQAYAANRQQFLHSLLQHMLVLSWPLLLVKVGIAMASGPG